MRTDGFGESLQTLFKELVAGAPDDAAYILNPRDAGLLRTLDDLPAEAASASRDGGATVAAHTAHLAFALSLLNRWTAGENPFAGADWAAAWRVGAVDEARWKELRQELRREATRWGEELPRSRDVDARELNGMIASVAHVAYHLGAIRQIAPATRGPRDTAGEDG
jgi:hypothetical protein